MDLIAGLRAFAFRRPHVLPLVGAGATRQRLAAERWLRTRGWPIAATPADADILLIGGAEAKIADAVYAGMPLPKSRTEVLHGDAIVAQALEAARARLFEGEHPVEAPAHNLHSDHGDMHVAEYAEHDHPKEAPGGHGEYAGHGQHSGHGEHDHAGLEHGEHEHHEHNHAARGERSEHDQHAEHGGHGSHDHAGHHMHSGVVDGLPMAERAEDRDGLKLDVLHVPFGPVLPAWPAGLVVDVVLQGDIVQQVTSVDISGERAHPTPFWDEPWLAARSGKRVTVAEAERRRAASHLDSLNRLLDVLGAEGDSVRCAVLRDEILAGEEIDRTLDHFQVVGRRLRRSRSLRRMTDGLGVLYASTVRRAGIGGPALRTDGDVTARMTQWLLETEHALRAVRSAGADLLDADASEGPRGSAVGETNPTRPSRQCCRNCSPASRSHRPARSWRVWTRIAMGSSLTLWSQRG
jgi:hypothetical protein